MTLIGFILAHQLVDPAPPKNISLATGGADGAYYLYGQRYRKLLQRPFEPLWVFYRAGPSGDGLGAFRGKRLAAGAEGSGTRAVAMRIMAETARRRD